MLVLSPLLIHYYFDTFVFLTSVRDLVQRRRLLPRLVRRTGGAAAVRSASTAESSCGEGIAHARARRR